jgi:hypothetical protein
MFTVDAFKAQNTVLSSRKILHENKGIKAMVFRHGGPYDVIDINKNGQADTKKDFYPGNGSHRRYAEPVILRYERIKEYAAAHQKEVITQDDIGDVELGYVGYGPTNPTTPTCMANTSSAEVMKELCPFDPDTHWAIDVANNEFLVYTPKLQPT